MPTRTPLWLLLGAVLLASTTGHAHAAAPPLADPEPVLADTALAQVPYDASFFAAALRNKEQLDRLRNSNAFALLKKSPAYKIVIDLVKRQLEEQGVSPELLDRLLDDRKKKEKDEERSENEELIELLLGSAGDEVFVYGGKGWTELAQLGRKAIGTGLGATTEKLGDDPFNALSEGGKAASLLVQKNKESLRVPELVVGMRIRDAKKLKAHVERLEKEVAPLLAFDKRFEGKLKRNDGMLTLELDGSFVPWEELEFGPLADKDAVKDVIEHLKKATLAVSVGVRGDYVLFAVGSSAKDLDRLDKGKTRSLAQRHELQPIARHEAKKVAAVAYLSKDFLEATVGAPDWAAAAKSLAALVEKHVEKEEPKKGLVKELRELSAGLKKLTHGRGACSGYVVQTADGYEAFWHDFGEHDCKNVKTPLFEHVGEDAIFAAAVGFENPGATYALVSKHVRTLYGHLETAFLALEVDEAKAEYKKHAPGLLKALKQFDDAVSKQLMPALKGQSGVGLLVESKWKSKQWHGSLPATKRAMPMLEPALLLGLSDRDKFAQGLKESRLALLDLYDRTRAAAQGVALPDVNLPEAKKTALPKKGDLYAWPDVLAKAKLDEQVQLTMGLGQRVAVLSLSPEQAETLMTPKPTQERILESERRREGPLVAKRDRLVGGMVLNFPALIDVLQAWIDAAPELIPVNDDAARSIAKAVAKQARDVASVLRCFRQAQAATYLDGAKLTTHLRLSFEDLPESPEPPRRR